MSQKQSIIKYVISIPDNSHEFASDRKAFCQNHHDFHSNNTTDLCLCLCTCVCVMKPVARILLKLKTPLN